MAESYKDYSLLFMSKGIQARNVDDTLPPQFYLNLDNCEEIFENAFSQKLGATLLNGGSELSGPVNTLAKLNGLNGASWRYGADVNGNLYRSTLNTSTGVWSPYVAFASGFSGQSMWGVSYRPEISSFPYIYFADSNQMVKDNGTLTAPQKTGIFQPQYPCVAQDQMPYFIVLEDFDPANPPPFGGWGTGGGVTISYVHAVATTLSAAITAAGMQEVQVADPTQIHQFQWLNIGGAVGAPPNTLVLEVTANGFIANVPVTAASGANVSLNALRFIAPVVQSPGMNLPSISAYCLHYPSTFLVPLQKPDYIVLQMYVSDPANLSQVQLAFDCGDNTFTTNFFYKVTTPAPTQVMLNNLNNPVTGAADIILTEALGIYNPGPNTVSSINCAPHNVWTTLMFQLSDFTSSGSADFDDPVFNWNHVHTVRIQVVPTNGDQSANIELQFASLILMGGFGADTLGGVGYDYRYTFYNNVDGTESNPSMAMASPYPPSNTTLVYPRRQPVQVTMTWSTPTVPFTMDPQVTSLRIYRRGGTLGDNWRRLDEVLLYTTPASSYVYFDNTADENLAGSDFLSLLNDVPVTSTLPVPVNTRLTAAIGPTTPGTATLIPVASTLNMSPHQQVLIGSPTDPSQDFEIVICLQVVNLTHFYGYLQNPHANAEPVSATAKYGQPVNIQCLGYNMMYYAGDAQNPHYLYFSQPSNPQAVGSASYIEVGTPDDGITFIANIKGNIFVSTKKYWWSVAPGSQGKPTVYPTTAKHGSVGRFGAIVTEKGIYFLANDGVRFFAGGGSDYLTQGIEFLFQAMAPYSTAKPNGIYYRPGVNPIIPADTTKFSQASLTFWNNMIFVSYMGTDGGFHRVILHTIYGRWRNDDMAAIICMLEEDTNQLLFGDPLGHIYLDRQDKPTVDVWVPPIVVQGAVPIDLLTCYQNQGFTDITKQYNSLMLDCNTNGQTLNARLWFNDGQISYEIGTFSTTQRAKYNLNLNSGLGYAYYNVALEIYGSVSDWIYLYQVSISAAPLARVRKSFDTYDQNMGSDETKISKQVFIDYTASADITCTLRYDDVPRYTFTLPNTNGSRRVVRVRLPAIAFRLYRLTGSSTGDFQIWEGSFADFKIQCFGKGYQRLPFALNQ